MKGMLTLSTVEHLKNILYYCHKNLILTIELMLKNICFDYKQNIWVKKLLEIVKEKKSKTNKGKNEVVIEQNNNILFNCIGNFILLYFNNKADIRTFSVLNDIMCNIDRCSLESVKNNLSNLKNMIIFMAENAKNSFVHINLNGPFLPKKTNKSNYTLVLDLDETLIHCLDQQEITPLIRPGTEKFLEEMSKYYEVVIFTASVKDYADTILDQLDPEHKFISFRLYREHTTVLKRTYLKDISKLGRDLSKVIIIDNASDNFRLQTDNGIFINTWIDDQTDTILLDLIPILKEIVIKKIPDVRKALRKIRDTMIRFYVKGDPNPFQTVLKYITGEKQTIK
jgi:CTD small phosphatase-like protein 2